jgi:hypothetical protein
MIDKGLGARLLCCVFGYKPQTPPGEGSLCLVYLTSQGTFYPFAPLPDEQRDNELELRARTFIGTTIPIEKDLARWSALWGQPVS